MAKGHSRMDGWKEQLGDILVLVAAAIIFWAMLSASSHVESVFWGR